MLNISEEVLAVLVDNNLDHKDVVKKLALHHPDILMRILHVDDLTYAVQAAYNKDFSKKGNKVAAIKKYRELAGTDLKSAKIAVEQLMHKGEVYCIYEREQQNGWHDDD